MAERTALGRQPGVLAVLLLATAQLTAEPAGTGRRVPAIATAPVAEAGRHHRMGTQTRGPAATPRREWAVTAALAQETVDVGEIGTRPARTAWLPAVAAAVGAGTQAEVAGPTVGFESPGRREPPPLGAAPMGPT